MISRYITKWMLSIEQEGSVRVILAWQLQWKSPWQSSPHCCFEKRKEQRVIDEGRVGDKCGSLCIVENILPLCIFSYSTCQRQLLCSIELVDSYNLYPFFFFFPGSRLIILPLATPTIPRYLDSFRWQLSDLYVYKTVSYPSHFLHYLKAHLPFSQRSRNVPPAEDSGEWRQE